MGRLWLIHNIAKCLRFKRNEQSYNKDKTDGTMKKQNNDEHNKCINNYIKYTRLNTSIIIQHCHTELKSC